MSNVRTNNVISKSKNLRHGHIFSPASRAYFAWLAGDLDEGALNQRESGKFFPSLGAGILDAYAPDDIANAAAPPDGKIASANQITGLMLDEPGTHWRKHEVRGGDVLDISWNFTANHPTRRWNYFITTADWDPQRALARDQFEAEPFYTVQNNLQPFWAHPNALRPPSPTHHQLPLPERVGYHVLLAVWEVADTPMAFYQVLDLDFVDTGSDERPTTPADLATTEVTDKQVALSWNASSGTYPIAYYRLTRNGITTVDIEAPLLNWTDNSVAAQTLYTYFISAIDENGNLSAPSRAIEVNTLSEGGEDAPPTPPKNLHSMVQTATGMSLMWGASTSHSPITHYVIYRDGHEIKRVSASQTTFEDTGLTPITQYRYFVAALDQRAQWSVPSNVLTVKTDTDEGGSQYPAWSLNTSYKNNDLVSHEKKNWKCLQAHISYVPDWAPGNTDTLWTELTKRT